MKNMKKEFFLVAGLMAFIFNLNSCNAQQPIGTNLLQLDKIIPLPNIKGRIDHLDINLKTQVLYVAALGNNTLEAVDLRSGKILHSITGLDEPQGVGYIPQQCEIFVANGGNGECYFYNAKTFDKTGTIKLSGDADDVRYDSANKKIYVGYGEGGMAVIDAITHKQIADVKLPAHPESFQIDSKQHLLFVNVPGAKAVGVVSLDEMRLTDHWLSRTYSANFPMAIDTSHQRIFVGYRHPAKLVVFNSKSGEVISENNMASDADDLYFDYITSQIFVSGGSGHINIFKQQDANSYILVGNISTRSGARTSLLIPSLNLFILAERAEGGKPANLSVYKVARIL
jgi:DNA-binding beta-propeller fold protein YncE